MVRLDPFCEIVDAYYEIFDLSFPRGKRPYYIHSPLTARSGGVNMIKLFLLNVSKVVVLLKRYTFLNKLMVVCLHCWPEISGMEFVVCHALRPRMVFVDSPVHLPYYIFYLFLHDTF